MGERTSYPAGAFSWVDLQTDDLDGAKAFYADLLGWSYNDIPIGDGAVYSMAKVQGTRVAGLGERQDESIPPHWNCYVTVADVDASRRARWRARRQRRGAALRRLRRRPDGGLRRSAGRGALDLAGEGEHRGAAGQRPRGADLERPESAGRRGVDRVLQRALRLGDRRGPGRRRPVLVDHQRRPDQRRDHADRPRAGTRRGTSTSPSRTSTPTLAKASELGGGDDRGPDGRAQRRRASPILRDPSGAVFSVSSGPMDD